MASAQTTKTKPKSKSSKKPIKKVSKQSAIVVEPNEVDDEISNVQQVVRETLAHTNDRAFPVDEELEIPPVGPDHVREFKSYTTATIIDELVKDIPQNEGWYIKLYKEMLPNEYQFKLRVDHFHHWADVEWEIANIVKSHTEKAPTRWGTGRYKVCFMREKGTRGQHYDPYFFYIDAGEEQTHQGENPYLERSASLEEKLAELDKLASIVKNLTPQQIDPGQVAQNQASALMKGYELKIGEGSQANQQNNQMMMLMMTMMKEFVASVRPSHDITPKDPSQELANTLNVLKVMNVLPTQQPKERDFFEDLVKMKTIGLEPFKTQDPLNSLTQVKSIIGLAKDFFQGEPTERPGIAEKLVDAVANNLPTILGNIKGLSDNYTNLQLNKSGSGMMPTIHMDTTQPPTPREDLTVVGQEPSSESWPMGTIPGRGSAPIHSEPPKPVQQEPPSQSQGDEMFKQFMNSFYQNMINQNQTFYPVLLGTVQGVPQGTAMLNAVLNNQMSMDQLVSVVHQWGGESFQAPNIQPTLRQYLEGFIRWIVSELEKQTPPQPSAPPQEAHHSELLFVGRCNKCGTEFEYRTREEFETEDKVCEELLSATEQCDGMIELLVEDQQVS